MNEQLAKRIGDELIRIGNEFKAGNSNISEEEAIDIFSIVAHQRLSREEVCDELNINNSKFYDLITIGKLPPGRKYKKSKEKYWYKDEISKLKGKV